MALPDIVKQGLKAAGGQFSGNMPQFSASGRVDPYKNFKFLVEIDGVVSAGFMKASGLKMTTDEVEYREGGDNVTPHKSPGQTKFDNLTFERGMSESLDLWNWASEIFSVAGESSCDPAFRRNISVILMDRCGMEAKRWSVYRAWPSAWETDDFDAMDSGIAIERLVITHEGFDLV